MNEKVMIAGHLCLDLSPQFSVGPKMQISQMFSPGKLTNVGKLVLSTGGVVSNTGLTLAKMGVDAILNGKIGTDEIGNIVREKIGPERAKAFKIVSDQNTSYTIVLAPPGVDHFVLHDPATNDTFGPEDIDYKLAQDCILFHFGYPPLMKRMHENGGAELAQMYKQIKALGVTTSLDMATPDPSAGAGRVDWIKILEATLPYVDIFLPSIGEIAFMIDRDLFDKRNAQAAERDPVLMYEPKDYTTISDRLLSMGAKIVVIKCGIRGLYLRSASLDQLSAIGSACPNDIELWAGREMWAPTFKAEVFSSALGAGDATIAGFLCGLIRNFSPEDALQIANTLGWQNVQTVDALSGIRDWPRTLELLRDKNRLRNPLEIDGNDWRFSTKEQLYYGPNDKGSL